MVSPDAGAAPAGRPRTAGPSPRTPRSPVGSPETSDLQEGGGWVILTDREAARLQTPPVPVPPPRWPAAAAEACVRRARAAFVYAALT